VANEEVGIISISCCSRCSSGEAKPWVGVRDRDGSRNGDEGSSEDDSDKADWIHFERIFILSIERVRQYGVGPALMSMGRVR
jgi:hypothetical protein